MPSPWHLGLNFVAPLCLLAAVACGARHEVIVLDFHAGCNGNSEGPLRFDSDAFPDIVTSRVPAAGHQIVHGYVRSSSDSTALQGVQVYVPLTEYVVSTDALGRYELEYPRWDADSIRYELVGFRALVLPIDSEATAVRADVQLGMPCME